MSDRLRSAVSVAVAWWVGGLARCVAAGMSTRDGAFVSHNRGVTFATLALIGAVALFGPVLAWKASWHVPVVLGELLAGIVLGTSGLGWLRSSDSTFMFLGTIGFALVMFVAGTHVPLRDPNLRQAAARGVLQAVLVGVVSAVSGWGLAAWLGTGHGAVYAVLLASSSAALVLPIVNSLRLSGQPVLRMLPQVAIADAACIVALPLVIDPVNAGQAALGSVALIVVGMGVYFVLCRIERNGVRKRAHNISEVREFALELRVSLIALFAMAALATVSHVSVMLAGFVLGLAVAGVGEPRRVAHQLFAVTEGFFAPLFFVWLGSELNVRALGAHPQLIWLGVALGVGAVAVKFVNRALGQPLPVGMLAAAQLGVPVAAATVGTQLGVLFPGEASAFMLGALITIGAAVLGGALAARKGTVARGQA